jgi:hypothetical protein
MKNKCIPALAFCLCLAAAGAAVADITVDLEAYFNDFLGRLAARHPSLESLSMPEREVRGTPGSDDPMRAAIILTFASAEERGAFQSALSAEDIPFATFPEKERDILLFGVDMASFIMMDAIGL